MAERKCLLSEFVYIWPCLKALIFRLEGKTFSIQTSNSSPPGRQTSSYPLTSGREGQRITPILIGAEVSYFRFLLYRGKIFHMYLQCITDSQNFGKTGRSLSMQAASQREALEFPTKSVSEPGIESTWLVVIFNNKHLV